MPVTDSPTMDQLNSLPYLESVVREALRLYAPVSGATFLCASRYEPIYFCQVMQSLCVVHESRR